MFTSAAVGTGNVLITGEQGCLSAARDLLLPLVARFPFNDRLGLRPRAQLIAPTAVSARTRTPSVIRYATKMLSVWVVRYRSSQAMAM